MLFFFARQAGVSARQTLAKTGKLEKAFKTFALIRNVVEFSIVVLVAGSTSVSIFAGLAAVQALSTGRSVCPFVEVPFNTRTFL